MWYVAPGVTVALTVPSWRTFWKLLEAQARVATHTPGSAAGAGVPCITTALLAVGDFIF